MQEQKPNAFKRMSISFGVKPEMYWVVIAKIHSFCGLYYHLPHSSITIRILTNHCSPQVKKRKNKCQTFCMPTKELSSLELPQDPGELEFLALKSVHQHF